MTKQDNSKDKVRVYEYAKSLNMSSKEIITILKRLGKSVNNHMSVMENDAVESVEKFFKDVKANAAAKRNDGAAVAKPADKPAGGQEPKQQTVAVQPKPEQRQPAAQVQSAAPRQSNAPSSSRPQGQSGGQSGRPQGGQGQGGSSSSSRPQGDSRQGQGQNRQGGQGSGRPQGQGQGGGFNRGGGQGQGQGSGRPQGQGQGGGFNRSGQGGQGSTGGSQGGRGPGQRPQGQQGGGQQAQRPDSRRGGFDQRSGGNRPVGAGTSRPTGSPVQADGDDNANKGAANKKTKPGQRRFDDFRSGGNNRGPQNRGNQRNQGRGGRNNSEPPKPKIDNTPKKIIVRGTMTVGEMAKALHKDASEVIKKLLFLGVMATINQELDLDAIQLLASDYGVEVELKIPVEEDKFEQFEENDDEADLLERPPVVTIMGHVDHGKTTLLDAIRKTNVTEGEAGGITQHIGAYQAETNGKKITFLDTPGHAAFTSMRARGAQVTDITIIVVAADDGVMPQTVEAISHAKAANVPIIVAVNKIDKPDANADRIKQELTEYELVPEEWGGDTIFCNISAKQRIGLENLLDMILLVAEVQEFKANPNKRARGTVIEAELDKGKGPVARVLIQHGTLKVGDSFVAGVCFGRVRAMVNDKGRKLKEAGPSTPVEITGLTEVPQAGDPFLAFEDERKARAIAEKRAITLRQSEMGANARVTLDDLYKQIKEGEIKDLNVIIKADVQGSAEALKGSLEKIDVEGARVKILHSGVGAVTESDVILASASNAIVIGFNVRPEPQAKNTADQEKVDIRLHSIIYKVMEEIEQAMKGLLDPEYKEVVIGHAEVRNIFKVSKVGVIAGCMVTDGKIARNAEVRLVRGGIVVFQGKIDSLKRFKDDAKEVAQGYECGISLDKYNDIKEGDTIEAFVMETVER
ncbi:MULTISPECIES: translation initiation factor IF-2 [unclassified Paenibacillus]|uniref:translation initiation factor IF-2 n=1 Tax=unclassified Paenibacillus TaxID=185978 RepID=UPI001AE8B092|nr:MULTISPECIES: translation initiation factor IF-2 [unclassified Paenibacillus]MBP1155963.1 translation initiation factor IF-2 [Paenibacillus sp. PvP091]MBP1168651.1 translation initiation factor IF-2 [Paenibacillus sp. PvR098]MBP2439679.1 translation initiation factor IF-2 [Paenibacillus sp. PvP052]